MSSRTRLVSFVLGLASLTSCARVFDRPVAADELDACAAGGSAGGMHRASACPESCDRCEAGVCRIDCGPGSSCESDAIVCPPGMDCTVACEGDRACTSASIAGPEGYALAVACDGRSACAGTSVAAGLDVELRCEGASACDATNLRCGSGNCDWTCASAGSCDALVVR
ncbi:MAG: hypothetical protein IPK74_26760 [Deltaproteobacteria bacterium]|nr:hypothetical protein [Deltaproteobacteria bacterium]